MDISFKVPFLEEMIQQSQQLIHQQVTTLDCYIQTRYGMDKLREEILNG